MRLRIYQDTGSGKVKAAGISIGVILARLRVVRKSIS